MVNGQWGGFGQDPDGPNWDRPSWDEPGRDGPGRDEPGRDSAARHQEVGRPRHRHGLRRNGLFSGRRALLGFGVTGAGLAAVALAIAVTVGQVTGGGQACAAVLSGTSALSNASSQIATHYVLTSLPNCSYPNPPANQLFVALSPSEYNSAAACGGYLKVTGPDGSVIVQVIDQCPECATGHIDLSEPAFAKLAPLSAGLINVSYSYLVNPALPGPITAEVKDGSSQYWLALLFDNTGNPLSSVQVKTTSGGWESLSQANYNYWIAQSGMGNGPFTVRLTDTQGHQVTISGITLSPGSVQSTGTYMYGAGSSTGTVAPTTPTANPPSTAAPATSASSASASRIPTSPAPSTPAKAAKASGTPAARRSATASAPATGEGSKLAAADSPSPPPSPHPAASASC